MQIRCQYCHKPFALSRETVIEALEAIASQNLRHYDAHCPHCRKANRVSPDELRRAAPERNAPTDVEEKS